MASRRRQRGQVLIVIFLGVLLFGGATGGSKLLHGGKPLAELRKQVAGTVRDDNRRNAALGTIDAIAEDLKQFGKERDQIQKDAMAALERHEASRADLEKILVRADVLEIALRTSLLGKRDELRNRLDEAEWAKAFAKPASP